MDRLDVQLYDSVKSYQRTIGQYITFFIIAEWLMEGGFDVDFSVENNEDWATMDFEEIDTDSLIKRQNHATSLWVQDGITHEEYRETLGKLPVSGEEEKRLYSDMIGKVNAKYKDAVDKAAAQKTSGGEGQKSNAKTRATKTSSVESVTSDNEWSLLKEEMLSFIGKSDPDKIVRAMDDIAYVYSFYFHNIEMAETSKVTESFWRGHDSGKDQALMAGYELKVDATKDAAFLSSVQRHTSKYVDKLKRDLRNRIESDCEKATSVEEMLEQVNNTFSVLHSRLDILSETESNAAYNYGIVCIAYTNKIDRVWREGSEDCDKCMDGFEDIKYAGIEDIPPISSHPNCKCRIKIL
jgi:hypothetical protein